MRSVRDWVAQAPAAAVAAALAVVVIGAGLFGFAIAELTSDDGADTAAPAAPAVVGGSTQRSGVEEWPKGLSAHTVILASFADRARARRAAAEARSTGLDAGILRSGGGWAVYSGHFTSAAGAKHAASELARRYPGAHHRFVQSSQ